MRQTSLTRSRIIECLRKQTSPIGPARIAEETGIAPSTVRFHLSKMANKGVIHNPYYGLYTLEAKREMK
jgi:predicted ArsR family transcriptional regulator